MGKLEGCDRVKKLFVFPGSPEQLGLINYKRNESNFTSEKYLQLQQSRDPSQHLQS